jgi:hypothetical protein
MSLPAGKREKTSARKKGKRMNISFEQRSIAQIWVVRDGLPVASIERVHNTFTWTLVAGMALASGTLTRMKREAVGRFCTCGECPKDRT